MLNEDPMDEYSNVNCINIGNLHTLYTLRPRRDPIKPGRELIVGYDERFAWQNINCNFKLKYLYYVNFFQKNDQAGNHYHTKKQEIFLPVYGRFLVRLSNLDNTKIEEVIITASEYEAVYINTKIAHQITSLEDKGILLVLATHPNSQEDEFHHKI